MSAQQRQKRWFDTGEKAEEGTPGKQDKDKCLPPRRAAPGAGALIPVTYTGWGLEAQKAGNPAVMGGRQAGGHRPGQQGLQIPGRGQTGAEGLRGERGRDGRGREGAGRPSEN